MSEISRAGVLLAVLSFLGPIPGQAAGAVPDYVMAAIADPARPPLQVARDAERKPGAVLAFAGVKPGDRVADFMSGGREPCHPGAVRRAKTRGRVAGDRPRRASRLADS